MLVGSRFFALNLPALQKFMVYLPQKGLLQTVIVIYSKYVAASDGFVVYACFSRRSKCEALRKVFAVCEESMWLRH